jgi:hypothetical protein
MSWKLCLFGKSQEIFAQFSESLENFAYSAKVSDLGKCLGNFIGRIWYKCHYKKFVSSIWQTKNSHYSAKV